MRLSSRGILEMDASASISYHAGTGAVNIFLHGCKSEQQKEIRDLLQANHYVLAGHPLLLPNTLVAMKLDLIERQENNLWEELVKVETLSKQTNRPAVGSSVSYDEPMMKSPLAGTNLSRNNISDSLQRFTIQVLGVLQEVTYIESHAKALLLLIDKIQRSIDAVNKLAESPQREYIANTGAMLSDSLDILAHRTQVLLADIQFIEKRAQAQQSAV